MGQNSYPERIIQLFSTRWDAYTTVGGGGHKWTWAELKKTFEALISDKSLRFALFLDGDHGDLVDLIIAMSS